MIEQYKKWYIRKKKEAETKRKMIKAQKWFSWWALFFWTFLFNIFGTMGYLIYKGNRKQYNKD